MLQDNTTMDKTHVGFRTKYLGLNHLLGRSRVVREGRIFLVSSNGQRNGNRKMCFKYAAAHHHKGI